MWFFITEKELFLKLMLKRQNVSFAQCDLWRHRNLSSTYIRIYKNLNLNICMRLYKYRTGFCVWKQLSIHYSYCNCKSIFLLVYSKLWLIDSWWITEVILNHSAVLLIVLGLLFDSLFVGGLFMWGVRLHSTKKYKIKPTELKQCNCTEAR